MKQLYNKYIGVLAVSIGLSSCVDYMDTNDYQVEKPANIAEQEVLNAMGTLGSYIDTIANPNFKLGGAIDMNQYSSRGLMYRLINSNFHEVTAGYGMKHGAIVQSNGNMNFDGVNATIEAASAAGTSIYGHTLVWHANQNAGYLNGLLAPLVVESPPFKNELDLTPLMSGSMEGWQTKGEVKHMENEGMGEGTSGIMLSAVSGSDPESVQLTTPPIPVIPGKPYEVIVYVKSDVPGQGGITFEGLENNQPAIDWMNTGTDSTSFGTDISWKEIRFTVNDVVGDSFQMHFNFGYEPNVNYSIDISNLYVYDPTGEPAINNLVADGDFENGNGWGGWGNGSSRGVTEDGMGFGGSGKAFSVTNPSKTAGFWEVQTSYDFAAPLNNGEEYKLSFWVKGDAEGIIRPELQSPNYSSNGFGQVGVTKEWKQVTLSTVATADDRIRFVISYGEFAGTVYLDNVVLSSANLSGGSTTLVYKTDEEKRSIVEGEFERWISGMLTTTKDYIKAWDIVNEPMDDANPSELKTGVGNTDLAADIFYWQDYLGKDYAVKAIELAEQYGNPDDLLFINDYNLEYSLEKCQGIIDYVNYIETKGVTVDGIGTQMHINIDSDKDKIVSMFKMLAATGKLVKVSELDVRVNTTTPTAEILQMQREMYKYVAEMYVQHVPEAQRYGITVWGVTDSPENANWLPGEKQGLWDLNLNRKPAYAGFAEGLEGM
ncbi:Carbohydrate binding domain-containing protein [Algoriphagus locisalis]|uniref:Beta-xylanase n=1 Tax=Algoriphagus locisalis TaxID=305507 RepID=A0A1I7DQK6_9BACT|nr:endo-1,4-beta-xylanase [Algoriphagus locisalis]SFU13904.1 Carbohydrate binding domain-containing protein [Algoriphagus locisalis]